MPSMRSIWLATVLLATAAARGESARPVLSQDLDALEIPDKVTAVLWTRRPDAWTLQVVLSPPRRLPSRIVIDSTGRRRQVAAYEPPPKVEAWLLRADGSRIAPVARTETPLKERTCPRCRGPEVLYRFSLPEGAQAASVALGVDDGYRVQRLQNFVD